MTALVTNPVVIILTNTLSFYLPRLGVDDEAKLKALQEVSDSFDVSRGTLGGGEGGTQGTTCYD